MHASPSGSTRHTRARVPTGRRPGGRNERLPPAPRAGRSLRRIFAPEALTSRVRPWKLRVPAATVTSHETCWRGHRRCSCSGSSVLLAARMVPGEDLAGQIARIGPRRTGLDWVEIGTFEGAAAPLRHARVTDSVGPAAPPPPPA